MHLSLLVEMPAEGTIGADLQVAAKSSLGGVVNEARCRGEKPEQHILHDVVQILLPRAQPPGERSNDGGIALVKFPPGEFARRRIRLPEAQKDRGIRSESGRFGVRDRHILTQHEPPPTLRLRNETAEATVD